jgi:hypothetical protein
MYRRMLPVLFLIAAAAILVTGCSAPVSPVPAPDAISPAGNGTVCPELVFTDQEFAFELRRTLSAVYSGEADLGECLATGSRITGGDFESWYREWNRTSGISGI